MNEKCKSCKKAARNILRKVWKAIKQWLHALGFEVIRNQSRALHVGGMLPANDFSKYLQFPGFEKVGIVIQGPMDRNNDFTINTIKQLRYMYPDIKIVLSTWTGEVTNGDRLLLNKLNCNLIVNDSLPAENKGFGRKVGHLNNQLLSSIDGITFLKQQGAEFVMKMRTDTRLYKNDFIPYLFNLIHVCPCEKSNQNFRLINVAFSNNLVSVPFFMSDFIWFGAIEDMERLYSIPTREEKDLVMLQNLSEEQLRANIGKSFSHAHEYQLNQMLESEKWTEEEQYIYYNYREEAYITHTYAIRTQLCEGTEYPMQAYYQFLKDYIIVVDETELMAYFDKYDYSENSAVYSPAWAQLTHSMWLDIMLNYKTQ